MQRSKKVSAGFLFAFLVGLVLVLNGPRAAAQSGGGNQGPATVTLMVKLSASMSAADRQALMDRYGATVKSDINKLGIEVVEIPADNAATAEQNLRQEPGVLRVEESKTRRVQALPNDAQVGSQWALPQIAWDQVYGSVNPQFLTKVAILDTGVEATHTDLMGSLAAGTSIIDGSGGLTDLNGHGTWLAGIVAARTNNIDGVAGVGYQNVQVMPVKVADANGDAQDDDVVSGVMWATDNGASVILMAFSNTGFSDSLQDAIDYAWANNVVLVAAVGNDGSSTATFPAGDRGVMGVSATDQSDNLASGSNYGGSVFIAAPGVSILGTGLNNSYVALSGTSASAAIVAGAAALMRAVDPTLSNGVVVNRLAKNADPAGTQDQTGNGRLQIARAIADTDTTSIQPAGTAPVGGGGPFVGPYHISSKPNTVTVGTQTPSPIAPSASATYSVVVAFNGSGSACTAPLTTSTLPTGATASFSPTSVTNTSGNSTLTISTTGAIIPGSYTFTVTANNGGGTCQAGTATSGNVALLVMTTTTTSIVSGTNPSIYGASVTFTATVTRGGGSGTPTGTVAIQRNGVTVCTTGPLSGSPSAPSASCFTFSLNPLNNPHSMTAVYGGDTSFSGSTSSILTQLVNPKPVTVTGLTANNKIYDATTAGATFTGTAALQSTELLGAGTTADGKPYQGDTVSVTGTPTGTFASANVANGINVNVTGLSLTGGAAANYTLTEPTLSANITAKALTISGSTASGRVYDGTTTEALGGTPALLAAEAPGAGSTGDGKPYTADSVSAGGTAAGAFADRNVGVNKPVTVSGVTIAGTGSGNYTATQQTGLTATITAKALTITGATASAKIYDGTATATLGGAPTLLATETAGTGTTSDGKPYGVDAVSAANTDSGTFADRNVGAAKPITVTGVTITGTGNGNYTATQQTGLTADITPKALTVAGSTAGNKVYDGTTAATLGGTPALLAAETAGSGTTVDGKPYTVDTVTIGGAAAGSFADRNVGNAKPVTVTGMTIGGADNGNYTVTQQTGLTANITAKALTYTGLSVPASRIYDGTAAAVVSGTAVLQATEAPGTGTTADGVPYSVDSVSPTGTPTGTYNTKEVATATTVTFGGISLTGAGNGNYTLTASTQAATITKKALTMSGLSVPASKIYNGNTAAVVSGSPGTLQAAEAAGGSTADGKPYSGDTVSLTGTATGTYDTKDVATASTVTFGGVSLTGAQAGDYSLTIQSPAAATITAKNLTITGSTAGAKIYDGTTAETLGGAPALQAAEAAGTGTTADGKPYTGDVVSASGAASGAFADRNVGNNKPVTVTGVSLTGGDSGNYTVTQQAGLTANITGKALAITGSTASAKVYDGTTTETLGGTPVLQTTEPAGTGTTSDGIPYDVDAVSAGGTVSGAFADRNVGVAKPVTVSGVTINGTGSGNYSATQQTGLTADITAKALTVSGSTAAARVYNATTVETLGGTPALLSTEAAGTGTTSDGKPYAVDSVSASNTATGAFADANVGPSKPVTVSGVTITGTGNGNYTPTQQTGLTANITAKALTVTGITATDKAYDATTNATLTGTATLQTAEAPGAGTGVDGKPYVGDAVSVAGTPTGSFADKNVGSGINVTISGLTLTQPASNYTLTAPTDTANITKKALTVAGLMANDKTYDTNTNATLSGTAALQAAEAPGAGSTADGIPYTGDTVSVTGTPSGTFASANAGNNINVNVTGLSLTGAQVGNYSLTALTLTATINKATATFNTPLTSPAAIPYGTATVSLSPNSPMILVGGNRVGSPDTVTITVNGVSSAPIGFNGSSGTFGPINFDTHALPVGSYPITYLYSGNANVNPLTDTSTTLTVNPKTLTASIIGNPTKPYDGNTNATLTSANFSIAGLANGNSFTVTKTSGSYNTKDVATATTVTASLAAGDFTPVGGTLASNYTLPTTASGAGHITVATVTASIVGNPTKPYDGNANATLTSANFSLTGLASGEGFTVTQTAGTYNSANVATATTVTATLAAGNFTPTGGAAASDYSLPTSSSGPGSITKVNATIAVTPYSVTYDAAAHTATGTAKGVLNETLAGLDLSGTTHTNAGDYPSDPWSFTDTTGNYNSTSGTVHDAIAKANATISVTPYSVTYDGAPHTATGTATGVGSVDLSADFNLTGTTHTNAGDYPSDPWSFTDATGNYNPASGTVHDAIAKANAVINVTPYSVTYDGNPHTATGTAKGVLNEALAGLDLSGTAHTDAGDYPSDPWSFTDATGNYNPASGTTHDHIDKAGSTTLVTFESGPYVYRGTAFAATATATGVGGLNAAVTPVLYSGDCLNVTVSNGCTATATFTGDANHTGSSDAKSITILKANAAWTTNPNSKTYGDPDPVPLTTGSGSGFLIADGVTASYSRVGGEAVAGYHITATLSATGLLSNYNITNLGSTFAITPKLATWTTNDAGKVFGDPDPNPLTTGSGSGFLAGDGVTATYSRDAGETVGDTHITATLSSTTGALGNYTITNAGATFTIGKYAFSVCDGSGHCTGGSHPNNSNIGGILTISPSVQFGGSATATVSLSPATVGGDDALTIPTTQFKVWIAPSGFPTQAVLFGTGTATKAGNVWTASITAPLDSSIMPGSYIAYVYGDDGDALTNHLVANDDGYITAVTGDFIYPTLTAPITVTKADATIHVTPYSVTYDGGAHTATATATGVGGADLSAGLHLGGTTHTNAGTYTGDAWSFSGGADYNDASGVVNDSIAKADAVISVTPYSVTYDGNPHTATGTAKGVLNEALSGLDLTHTTHTNAGTYSSDYWSFTDVTGNYNNVGNTTIADSIAKADAVISVTPYSVTYDGHAHTAAVASITGVNSETGATVGTVDVSNTTHTNAGTYSSDYWSFTDVTGNYNNVGNTTIADSIAKADAVISVTPYTVTYDGSSHTATVTSITGVNSETGATVGAVTLNTTHTNAGIYSGDYWTFTGTANYNDITAHQTITDTINKANATVVVTPYTVTYDGHVHTATVASITGVNSETGATVGTVDVSHTTNTNAGTYASDYWTFTGAANYNDITAHQAITDTINKANATVVVTPYTVTYDGHVHTAAVASITGVNSETGATVGTVDVSNTTHTNAGTYAGDSWSFTGANYNDIGPTTITDTINQASLMINVSAAAPVTYTALPYAGATVCTADGVNSEHPSTTPAFRDAGHNPLGGAPTNAGSYYFVCSAGGAGTNYVANSGSAAFTISQANASPVVTGYNVPYNANPHTATGSATAQGSDSLTSCFTVSGTTHANAGSYPADPWSFGGASLPCSNYQSVNSTVADAISQANASPVVTGYNVPYNANPHTATGSATAQGSDSLTSCFTLTGTTHTNAGSYPTDAWSFGGASVPCSNYQSVTSTVADKINKVTLTVTAPTLSINWGSALPPLPPSIAGFVPTETVAVLTSLPSCSAIGAAPTPAVGTYTTTCAGGTGANYTFAYVVGLLTVVDTTAPVVSNVALSAYAVPMGSTTPVTLTANVSDVTTGNSNISSAHYNVNGGPWLSMAISPASSPNVTATASLGGALFANSAVLNICVTGTDVGLNTSSATAQCAILAVYDASAGFVTGGGWIISPVNSAYPLYMSKTGKANFGFVSQYKKGGTVPTGNTQFQFQDGNLDFESNVYQWLVVSGSKAQFQGTGTINGTGNYGFQVFAYDGSVKGSADSMDGFRIQIGTMTPDGTITNIVYDNMFTGQLSPGSGTEPLDKTNGNGSIQIHSN